MLCGYPGSIASTWQEAGRAGRRKNTALTIMVASSSALDQYIVNHPEYFFSRSPENALVHPDNLYVLLGHVKCAAYELPFEEGESYAKGVSTRELLDYLCEEHILNLTGGRYYWMAEEFPTADLSLRSVTSENFLIIDITRPEHRVVIGEMDRYPVPMLLHEHAIYMHEGQQYQVEKLDFTEKKAYVRSVDVDYYTDADLNWMDKNSRSTLEMKDVSSRPAIEGGEENMDSYQTVFVGFPIWWYVAPRIVNTFLESYDFSGKTIVPFATSGGSGMGKTEEGLKKSCSPDAAWGKGKMLNGSLSKKELVAWAEEYL